MRQVNDSVTCLSSDGWSLLAGDVQGRLHVIEVRRSDAIVFAVFMCLNSKTFSLFFVRFLAAVLALASIFSRATLRPYYLSTVRDHLHAAAVPSGLSYQLLQFAATAS